MNLLLLRVIWNVFCEHLYGNIISVRYVTAIFTTQQKGKLEKYFNFIEKLHSNLAPSRRVLSTSPCRRAKHRVRTVKLCDEVLRSQETAALKY